MKVVALALMLIVLLCSSLPVAAQNRRERREARVTESGKPQKLTGGVTFQAAMSPGDSFDAAVKYLQLQSLTLDESSRKDLGQIISDMEIVDVGGFRNNNRGYRTYITLIRENDNLTTVRVIVSEQKRTKHLQAEPWGTATVNTEKTNKAADELKKALNVKP